MQYFALNDEEREFYQLTGRLPSDTLIEPAIEIEVKSPPKNKGGRPRIRFQINEKRAFYLWTIAQELPEKQRAKITNRKLIELAKTKPFHGVFKRTTASSTINNQFQGAKRYSRLIKIGTQKFAFYLRRKFTNYKTKFM